ncbi:Mavicyanin [Quillaja saponaria]|uniref:Mavicyanin n=1 Tax=Quillaja saponaria TaxID=32244 RepID=A0AAD7LB73_QUISA|nr:Mavicyanin [Quillaja saponaria]
MALVERAVAFFMVVMIMMASMVQFSDAAVYKVGDSAGWTTIGHVDYKEWAVTKNFQVGDVIIFEYNPQFHNVMRVTHAIYKSCNGSAPLATFSTGNDSITITTKGHHFFFCGVPGHCQAGQKVDINVPRDSQTAPTPSALTSPTVPVSNHVPAPSPNEAASLITLNGALGMLGMAMALFALFVPSIA